MRRPSARIETAHFRVALRPAPAGRARLGLAVGRKVGSAAVRNRVKRCVREVFRSMVRDPVDVLVMAKPETGRSISEGGTGLVARELGPALRAGAERARRTRRQRG